MSHEPHIYFDEVNERQAAFHRRSILLGGFAGLGLTALGLRLSQLQVADAARYQTLSASNQLNFRLVPPPRGLILDRNGVEIASNRPEFGRMGERLSEAVAALAEASRWMGGALRSNPDAALAGASPYLRLFGLAAGGIYLAKGALAAAREGGANGQGEGAAQAIAIARFFAENLATAAPGLKETVIAGADATLALTPQALSA